MTYKTPQTEQAFDAFFKSATLASDTQRIILNRMKSGGIVPESFRDNRKALFEVSVSPEMFPEMFRDYVSERSGPGGLYAIYSDSIRHHDGLQLYKNVTAYGLDFWQSEEMQFITMAQLTPEDEESVDFKNALAAACLEKMADYNDKLGTLSGFQPDPEFSAVLRGFVGQYDELTKTYSVLSAALRAACRKDQILMLAAE